MPGGEHNGNKVTIAVLGQKLDILSQIVKDGHAETREYRQQNEQRLRTVEERLIRCDVQMLAAQNEIAKLHSEDECLQKGVDQAKEAAAAANTRASWWNGVNTTLAVIAGIFGVRQ